MILFYFYFIKKTGTRPGRHNSTTAAATTAATRAETIPHRLRPLPQDLLHLERARLTPVGSKQNQERLFPYHEECLAIKLQWYAFLSCYLLLYVHVFKWVGCPPHDQCDRLYSMCSRLNGQCYKSRKKRKIIKCIGSIKRLILLSHAWCGMEDKADTCVAA